MRLPLNMNRRYAYLFGILVFSICFYIFLLRSYDPSAYIIWQNYVENASHSSQVRLTEDIFNLPPVDIHALRTLCETTQWNPDIVFTCDNAVGGIGNIRNSILNCVRYAISAGASMVVPRIIVRNEKDISKIRTGERAGMDYRFDVPHFVDSLTLSCPQLVLYRYVDNIPNRARGSGPIALLPESLFSEEIPKTGLRHPEAWRGKFFGWAEGWSGLDVASMETPVLIDLGRSYLQYPIYSDGGEMAVSFGGISRWTGVIE